MSRPIRTFDLLANDPAWDKVDKTPGATRQYFSRVWFSRAWHSWRRLRIRCVRSVASLLRLRMYVAW